MASDRVRELKAVLDRIAGQAEFDGDCDPDQDESLRQETISAFVAGGLRLLEKATPGLWQYYRTTVAKFTPEQRHEYGLPEIPDSADIWEHVSFPHEESTWHLGDDPARARSCLSFEGEVSWEPEHGLLLVFDDGRRIGKVGPCDGHLT